MTGRDREVLTVLAGLYPDWWYELRTIPGLPRWWAHRLHPPTAAQHAAGARPSIGRSTPERLASALGRHAEILDRIRR